ncbi:hypothetical protein DPMN_130984 [Dreissena polymorpha]|uniref:DSL domain-containing protein n=1 Tax=Dreissena polymorpha TaxID=45954 RepID=A0A9D4JYW2_DREPO|nr:hypothetical protein DPMN_130984 [Dreissena polymorpha]
MKTFKRRSFVLKLSTKNASLCGEQIKHIADYVGDHCEQTTTTTSTTTSTTTTTTTPTMTVIPCTPADNCTHHFTCGPQGQRLCLAGWTGPDCDVMTPGSVADCDIFES